jgi:hypothetical protein
MYLIIPQIFTMIGCMVFESIEYRLTYTFIFIYLVFIDYVNWSYEFPCVNNRAIYVVSRQRFPPNGVVGIGGRGEGPP